MRHPLEWLKEDFLEGEWGIDMKCPVCKSQKIFIKYDLYDYYIYECSNCSLAWTIGEIKPDYKNYHRDPDYGRYEARFRNIFLKRYKIIEKYKPEPGRVIEVGASTGILLSLFKERGWEAWGIEPSSSSKLAKKRSLKILKTIFEKANVPNSYFDVVILNHTLEHMDKPLEMLVKVKKILKKDGILFVDVPNFGGLSSRVSKQYWKLLLPEEHKYHFTQKSLSYIFKKAGLEVIHIETRSGVLDRAYPFLNLFDTKISFVGDILDVPGNIVATLAGQGSCLTMIGRKS